MKYLPINQRDLVSEETPASQSRVPSMQNKWFESWKKPIAFALFLLPWTLVLSLLWNGSSFSTTNDVTSSSCGHSFCAKERQMKLQNEPRNIYYDSSLVSTTERFQHLRQKGATIWFTGLSGSGKSTIGRKLELELLSRYHQHVFRLDGDNIRMGLNRDLTFTPPDREESVRRVGEVSTILAESGMISCVALVSPYRVHRDHVRALHLAQNLTFIEVFVDTPLRVVQARDTKGLYARAIAGELADFTGISSPYEPPIRPELHLRTAEMTIEAEVRAIVDLLVAKGVLQQLVSKSPDPAARGLDLLNDTDDRGLENIQNMYPLTSLSTKKKKKNDAVHLHSDAIPRILIRDEDVHWTQVLGEGWAAPLTGFMKEGAYLQSLHFSSILFPDLGNDTEHVSAVHAVNPSENTNFSNYQTNVTAATRWSFGVPIVLPIHEVTKDHVARHDRVILVSPQGVEIAEMFDLEIFAHRKEERVARTFGITMNDDHHHPYVQEILNSGPYLLGGEIRLLVDKIKYHDGLDALRLSPQELRREFRARGADVVFCFQTRNPTHAGHAYLMKTAREELLRRGYQNPILWLSPLAGWTKADDVPLDVRVAQHQAILDEGVLIDPNTTVLGLWPSPMIYAGPREVLWHASSRVNAGVEFFVVGRDPAGISLYSGAQGQKTHSKKNTHKHDLYAPDHGRYVLHHAPGLETLELISFPKVYYDPLDHQMKPSREHENKNRPQAGNATIQRPLLSISGSKMRFMAKRGLDFCSTDIPLTWSQQPTCVPPGFMSRKGWRIMIDYYQQQDSRSWNTSYLPYSQIHAPAPVYAKNNNTSQGIQLQQRGTYGHLNYQLFFHLKQHMISPWHDIPLRASSAAATAGRQNPPQEVVVNMVVEIARGQMSKMEMNKDEPYNPIMQDQTKDGRPRYYAYDIPFFNYGFLPQTWDDSTTLKPSGDNDPLDVIEIGSQEFLMGSIVPVKILGCLSLVDQHERDPKILALALSDPHAGSIETLDEYQAVYGTHVLPRLQEWLRQYKRPEGKLEPNQLQPNDPLSKSKALDIIQFTHSRWQALRNQQVSYNNRTSSFWLSP